MSLTKQISPCCRKEDLLYPKVLKTALRIYYNVQFKKDKEYCSGIKMSICTKLLRFNKARQGKNQYNFKIACHTNKKDC